MSTSARNSSAIPQARSLDKIREVVRCASASPISHETVVEKTGLSLRHAGYHLNAATTLGWLNRQDKGYVLTPAGRNLLDTAPSSHDEAALFLKSIAGSKVIQRVAPRLSDTSVAPDVHAITKSIQAATGLAFSTSETRAQTLVTWRRRIEKALDSDRQLLLVNEVGRSQGPTLVQVRIKNWKSFENAVLHVEPLTILIGANASGKSNALDALVLLQRLASGDDVRAALAGGPSSTPTRGGVEWCARSGTRQFSLGVLVASSDQKYDYHYSVTIEAAPHLRVCAESLERRIRETPRKTGITLFRTDSPDTSAPSLTYRLYNRKAGVKGAGTRTTLILEQLEGVRLRKEIQEGVEAVLRCLRSILVLDPVPSRMRDYSPLSDVLEPDGSNAAGVLAALPPEVKAQTERVLSDYAARLPERGVEAFWTEKVGKFESDAMLYARESWADDGGKIEIDSRGMSDGTLRFVAILTALLTRPPGSILVVEEIDNGFHPTRASLLLETLQSLGTKRRVDVIVTTHNQALLDAVGPELIPSVVVAHRQTASGASTLTTLEDLTELPRLLAAGKLGKAAATGRLGAFLAE